LLSTSLLFSLLVLLLDASLAFILSPSLRTWLYLSIPHPLPYLWYSVLEITRESDYHCFGYTTPHFDYKGCNRHLIQLSQVLPFQVTLPYPSQYHIYFSTTRFVSRHGHCASSAAGAASLDPSSLSYSPSLDRKPTIKSYPEQTYSSMPHGPYSNISAYLRVPV
jgi:hypothetical protein